MPHAVYHWLTANGLYPAIVTLLVGAAGGWLLGVRRAWRRHFAVQAAQLVKLRRIHDQLDTTTPGGLTTVVEALKEGK